MNNRDHVKRSRYRLPAVLLGAVLVLAAGPASALDFWHSNTTWAGQGMCAATFTFDSGLEHVQGLQVTLAAKDRNGKEQGSAVLEIAEFGLSNADRYGQAYWESEAACDSRFTLVVTRATAILEGKKVDLLKSGDLQVRDFKPFRLVLGQTSKGGKK